MKDFISLLLSFLVRGKVPEGEEDFYLRIFLVLFIAGIVIIGLVLCT